MKVKICGITCEEDARWAANLGVDYVGFNFVRESPRKVSPALAARVAATLPPFVGAIGVFTDTPPTEILDTVQRVGLKGVQCHGTGTPEELSQVKAGLGAGALLIRGCRVAEETDLEGLSAFLGVATHLLLDARVEGVLGGTGQTFPWALAVKAKDLGLPIFLAGGLTPDNVAQAIEEVRPFGVDVASGVERSVKRKDYALMKKFIEEARQA